MVGGVATSDRLVEPGGGGTCASDIAEAGTDAGRLNMEETDNNKQKPYRALLTVLAGFNKDLCCISEECLARGYNRDVQPLAEMDLTKPLSGTSTMSSSLLDFSFFPSLFHIHPTSKSPTSTAYLPPSSRSETVSCRTMTISRDISSLDRPPKFALAYRLYCTACDLCSRKY